VRLLIVVDEVPLAATLERGLRADGFACGLGFRTEVEAAVDAPVERDA
jgi:hypothetical protein